MTVQYIQKVKVTPSVKDRKKLIIGIAFCALSLIFVFLSAFINKYLIIGFFALFIVGVVFLQLYGNCASVYEYVFNGEKFVVAAKNMFGYQKRIIEIDIADIIDFSKLSEVSQNGGVTQNIDVVLCDIDSGDEVFAMTYQFASNQANIKNKENSQLNKNIKSNENNQQNENSKRRLLLACDNYMSALIENSVKHMQYKV